MNLLAELKRRNVVRMAGLYLVGAWLVVQVAGTLLPVFEAPAWIMRSLVAVLAIGFVLAVVFAWVFEWTPQGLRRDGDATVAPSIAPHTARRLDRAIIVVLVLALAVFALDRFVLGPRAQVPALAQGVPAAHGAVDARPAPAVSPKSIAVLPFADLSPHKDQEYFSDGIAEELLNALAKVGDLKVAGRTSSFSYKGRNEDLRVIGATLGVATVLEGSVRKQGERVRITAQLIQVEDGFHLWSDTYDGDLGDVFALQERVARAITDRLQVVLDADQQRRLVREATSNPEAYELFLKGTAILHRRDGRRWTEAIAVLQQATALDPDFARAHARLALVQALSPIYDADTMQSSREAARTSATRALALDAGLAEAHAALGIMHTIARAYGEADKELTLALAADAEDLNANFFSGTMLATTGYTDASNRFLDRVIAADPRYPNGLYWRGLGALRVGDLDGGEQRCRESAGLGLPHAGACLAFAAMARGDLTDARGQMATGIAPLSNRLPADFARTIAVGAYGDAEAKAAALALCERVLAGRPAVVPGPVVFALILLGDGERALDLAAPSPTSNDSMVTTLIWSAGQSALRKTPAFTRFVRRSGMAALWDVKGPPDRCRQRSDREYDCE